MIFTRAIFYLSTLIKKLNAFYGNAYQIAPNSLPSTEKNYPSTWLLLQPGKTIHFHLPPTTLGCDQLTSSAVNGFQLIFGPHHWKMYIRNCTETEKKKPANTPTLIGKSIKAPSRDYGATRDHDGTHRFRMWLWWNNCGPGRSIPKHRPNRTRCHFLLVLNKIEKKCNIFFLPFTIFQFVRNG